MNESDKNIDTVLCGLRDVHADEALQRRIVDALRLAERRQPAERGRWWFSAGLPWRVAGMGAAVCVALLVAAVLLREPHVHAPVHRAASSLDVSGPHGVDRRTVWVRPSAVPAPVRPARLRAVRGAEVRSNAAPKLAESVPAPPLPLTEQERLLLRMVHRNDPVQLAQLSAPVREARLEAEKQQVREFFKPAVPPDMTTMDPGGTQ